MADGQVSGSGRGAGVTSDNIKSGVYLVAIAAAGYVAWKAYKGAAAVGDTLSGLTDWARPKTMAQHEADYSQSLTAAKATAATGGGTWTNLFTANPNNYNPYDLIPEGYTMNQYGDLVKKIESGGGGTFNGTGATASW